MKALQEERRQMTENYLSTVGSGNGSGNGSGSVPDSPWPGFDAAPAQRDYLAK